MKLKPKIADMAEYGISNDLQHAQTKTIIVA